MKERLRGRPRVQHICYHSHVFMATVRYILRNVKRSLFKSILTSIVAMSLLVALSWMTQTIDRVGSNVDSLYDSILVDAAIVPTIRTNIAKSGGGIISKKTVDEVLGTGLISDVFLVAGAQFSSIAVHRDGGKPEVLYEAESANEAHTYDDEPSIVADMTTSSVASDEEMIETEALADILEGIDICSFNNPERFFSTTKGNISVVYADGWDTSLFSVQEVSWQRNESIAIIIPVSFSEMLGIGLGDAAYLTKNSFGRELKCVVVGIYVDSMAYVNAEFVLMPWPAMSETMGSSMMYSTAEFTISPEMNRELASVRDEMRNIVERPNAGLTNLHFQVWDGELRMVVEPMEKNHHLLLVLYPIAVLVSALVAVILSLLLLLLKAKEAAIMRVLGASRALVRLILCSEQLFATLIGLLLGLVVSVEAEVVSVLGKGLISHTVLYIAGCLFGSFAAAMVITGKKPLEMLQVKE